MFCEKCGAQIPDGSASCPACGAPLSVSRKLDNAFNNAAGAAQNAFGHAEQQFGSAVNEMAQSFNGNGPTPGNGPLKTDRGLIIYILLGIITCGIYGYYFLYSMARDVNIACEGDGENTGGLVEFIVLSFITCGIYSIIWQYKLGNRLATNSFRYGMNFQENGSTVLMWDIFGSLLCGIGPFVGMNILIKNTNLICAAYNRVHGYYAPVQ